jgi:hypothetical protein
MKLPKKLLHRKLSEQELIEILENLEKRKARAIKNQHYETAASIRDEERKYRELFEDLLNSSNQNLRKNIHIVGLGGAGCTILQEIYKQFPNFKFTMITNPRRNNLPGYIYWIPFTNYFGKHVKLTQEGFQLPQEIIDRLSSDELTVLLFGAGGPSGTFLTDQLIQYLEKEKMEFLVAGSWPLDFEGNQRYDLANEFYEKYDGNKNIFLAFDESKQLVSIYRRQNKLVGHLLSELNEIIISKLFLMLSSCGYNQDQL